MANSAEKCATESEAFGGGNRADYEAIERTCEAKWS